MNILRNFGNTRSDYLFWVTQTTLISRQPHKTLHTLLHSSCFLWHLIFACYWFCIIFLARKCKGKFMPCENLTVILSIHFSAFSELQTKGTWLDHSINLIPISCLKTKSHLAIKTKKKVKDIKFNFKCFLWLTKHIFHFTGFISKK